MFVPKRVKGTYHHRHETSWVNTPPRSGPTTEATEYVAPRRPVYAGTNKGVTLKAMIEYAPAAIPAAPTPAIALPTMKAVLLGATPQMSDPISKTAMASRNTSLRSKYLYPFPKVVWNAANASQEISLGSLEIRMEDVALTKEESAAVPADLIQ